MKRLLFIIILSSTVAFAQTSEVKPPNLIVIMTDDMGYADVGFNGCKDIPTPQIDRIAEEGVRFTQGYVTFPVCGPSRAGFLTGRYQDRFGFTTNPSIDPNNPKAGLPVQEETIAEVLNKTGYHNAIIGKWHMGTHPRFHPLNRGFDYFYGFLSGGHNYFPDQLTLNDLSEVTKKWEWYRTKIIENRSKVETDEYLTDELSHAAVQYIEERALKDEHFMLFLAYNAPHTPMQATEKYLSRFPHIEDKRRKTYAAMVSAVDDGVGAILNTLIDSGLDENTLVVFLSDNGGANNNSSDNGPLRGLKGDLFEGGIRVPFAMRWKGKLPEGLTYENAVSSLDIMATIVAQTNVEIHPDRPLDGVNLIPYLTGESKGLPHDRLFWRKWEQNAMAILQNNYKLVANKNKGTNPIALFDLSNDLGESSDIKRSEKQISKEMLKLWTQWNSELKSRVFPTLGEDTWWTKKEAREKKN